MDSHSWRLLSIVVKSIPQVLFVLAGRPFAGDNEAPPEYQKIEKLIMANTMSPGPFAMSSAVAPAIKLTMKPMSSYESLKLISQGKKKYENCY